MEAIKPIAEFRRGLEQRVLAPLTRTGKGYYLLVGFLLLVVAWGSTPTPPSSGRAS